MSMENIALVVLDTLRSDHFRTHFDWLPGTRYENAWSTSHWTLPAHGSLFTGKYPSEIGTYSGNQTLDYNHKVLAERLSEAGYSTTGWSCNLVVSEYSKFDRGFDIFSHFGQRNVAKRLSRDPDIYDWGEFLSANEFDNSFIKYFSGVRNCIGSDCSTIRSLYYGADMKLGLTSKFQTSPSNCRDMGSKAILEKLQNTEFGGEDEFLYINLMESHSPYKIPEEYKDVSDGKIALPNNPVGEVEGQDVEALSTRYDNACRYLSDMYERIFNEICEDFDCIITLSDHGELLGENDFLGHAAGIYPELTNIVLSVYDGNDSVTENSSTVSLLDVHQTVLNRAGISSSNSRGRCLESIDEGAKVLTEYHGIPFPEKNSEELQEWGGDRLAHAYSQWRRGIAMEDGYYGYDSVVGWNENSPPPIERPKTEIERCVSGFDVELDSRSSRESMPRDLYENLENLGYLSH